MKKNKILITGGLGAIGKNLIELLLKKGPCQILVIDNLTSNNYLDAIFFKHNPSIWIEVLDIYDHNKLDAIVSKFQPDYIFHLAAHFANQNSVDFPRSDINANVLGTVNLLESARKLENLKKIVYSSSSCVYGSLTENMKEDVFVSPYETPYAINKLVGEYYMRFYSFYYKVPSISIRIFNTYGPWDPSGVYRNFIPNLIDRCLNHDEIIVTGDGSETRDFTFVSDTCEILYLASRYDGAHRVFNAGTGIETRIIDLINIIKLEANSKSAVRYVERRAWDDVKSRKANIESAKQCLGYAPRISLVDGLRKTIDWRKNQLK